MKTILVIDDEAAIREVIRDMIEGPEYRVLTAARALDGLEIARSENLDLLLLDYLMPGVSGMQMLEMLKLSPATATIPVVVMSGLGADESLFRLLALSAVSYLMKPFSPGELMTKVQNALTLRPSPALPGTAPGVLAHAAAAAGPRL